MEKLTMLEILEETVKYYSEDVTRRAKHNNKCEYTNVKGNHCAVGRCLLPQYQTINYQHNNSTLNDVVDSLEGNEYDLDSILQAKYHGCSIEFWENLQDLHDTDVFWEENGLSIQGKEKVKYIRYNFGV